LDDDVRAAIALEQRRIGDALAGADWTPPRWVQPTHMHVTLAFLGEIAEARVSGIVDAISPDLAVAPFTAVFDRLGVFPARSGPRVLWLGIGEGAGRIVELQQQVVYRLERVGIVPEGRPFQPHLTLGRWRNARPRDGRRALEAAGLPDVVARLPVERVTLRESRLSSAGPTYTTLARATLT
jgi:2'-5' RNA ligase